MTERHDPTENPDFLAAIDGATLPGMSATWDHPGFLLWTLDGRETGFYATPESEGAEGIAVNILREGEGGHGTYTETIPVEWTGDGVEDAHLYLAAMRRWQRTLPALWARWDGDPENDWVGNIIELLAEFDSSNLWEPIRWGGDDECSLLDILDEWSTYPARFDLATYGDNMVIRTTPFPPCECCGR